MNHINFPAGDTFVIIVDTNKYSGNFDQELAAYLIGVDTPRGKYGGYMSSFEDDAEHIPKLKMLEDNSIYLNHDDYGDVPATIWDTPGYVNDGHGRHFTDEEFAIKQKISKTNSYPAYQSVAFFFQAELKPEHIQLLRSRCDSFIEYYNDPDLKILGIRQLKISTKRVVEQTVISEI